MNIKKLLRMMGDGCIGPMMLIALLQILSWVMPTVVLVQNFVQGIIIGWMIGEAIIVVFWLVCAYRARSRQKAREWDDAFDRDPFVIELRRRAHTPASSWHGEDGA